MIEPLEKALVYHNVKCEIYPNGLVRTTVASRPIFKSEYWELRSVDEPEEKIPKPKNMDNDVRSDNVRRAKAKIFDIAMLNNFTHFVTWTLDNEKIDRYSSEEVSRKLKQFLNNTKKRHGLMYLIIPEYHKDGAIHMHGLISGDVVLVDSGHKTKDGKRIYNMPQWLLGYSTAIELDEQKERVSRYITKYVTKDFRKIFGSFYYAGGTGLIRKPPVELYDTNYFEVNAKEYGNKKANIGFKYITEVVNDDIEG